MFIKIENVNIFHTAPEEDRVTAHEEKNRITLPEEDHIPTPEEKTEGDTEIDLVTILSEKTKIPPHLIEDVLDGFFNYVVEVAENG